MKRGKILLLAISCLLMSCYSFRVKTKHGVAEPRPLEGNHPYYKDKLFVSKDTSISLKVWEKDGHLNLPCQNGIYSIEYKVSLGNLLGNFFSLGKRKRVKIIYVCIESEIIE